MPCLTLAVPGGGTMIVCTEPTRARRCATCRALTKNYFLCDARAIGAKRSCDAPVCAACRVVITASIDYCPHCFRACTPDDAYAVEMPEKL